MASGGSDQQGRAARLRPALGETIIGAGALVLAIVMFWQTMSIPVSPIYAKVGPTVVPIITALGLAMLGILLLIAALRGGWQPEEESEVTPDRSALLWVGAGLVLNVLLIVPAGFTLASIILFVCVARGFGSRAIVRDAADRRGLRARSPISASPRRSASTSAPAWSRTRSSASSARRAG